MDHTAGRAAQKGHNMKLFHQNVPAVNICEHFGRAGILYGKVHYFHRHYSLHWHGLPLRRGTYHEFLYKKYTNIYVEVDYFSGTWHFCKWNLGKYLSI